MSAVVVWEGAEALRPFLVEVGTLEPFPDNPRRGDVAAIRSSLRRFGQLKQVVVDGSRIVAGHHLVQAAMEEGWTHVAVLDHRFASEDEQRAFLLVDNRTSELGAVDEELLVAQLVALREGDVRLEGTGYTDDDLDARLAALRVQTVDAPSPLVGNGKREHRDPSLKEVVLMYSPEQLDDFQRWAGIVGRETGAAGVSEIVYSALRTVAAAS